MRAIAGGKGTVKVQQNAIPKGMKNKRRSKLRKEKERLQREKERMEWKLSEDYFDED